MKKKKKIDRVLGHDLWEIEAAYYVKRGLLDAEMAWWWVIVRHMEFNDLRPLRDAIAKAKRIDDRMVAIDGAILSRLIDLIDQGRLVVKPSGHGRPKDPNRFARDLIGWLRYERTDKSDAALKKVVNELKELGMTKDALRDAQTRFRKARTQWRKEAHAG